jgi:hypothetical protein
MWHCVSLLFNESYTHWEQQFPMIRAGIILGIACCSVGFAAGAEPADTALPNTYWSFRPLQQPKPPVVRQQEWVQTPIDRFILREIESRELTPSGPADRRTLIRRATYDLTGLPPTPAEIEDFIRDSSPGAFERVIERLLASPAYGERWGRHWLDVVRYADTAGDNSDYPVPDLYKYRNWVIRAFQSDLPYDRFVQEQIAGDLMPAATPQERHEKVIATGYLANSKRFGSYEDARYPWHLTIEDTIDNLGRTFLALTINCCRCHDHKFDPLTSADYYSLYGFFSSTRYPWPGIELDKAPRDLAPLAPAELVAAHEKERKQQVAAFDAKLTKNETDKAIANEKLKATESIANENERKSKVTDLTRRLDALKHEMKSIQQERERIIRRPLPFETAYAVAEGKNDNNKKVGNASIQIKGDPERLGPEVPRGFPAILGGQKLSPKSNGSGRLQLAGWLSDPANPLTARVMANRIWQHHFGRGLVPTPSDFGRQGQPPSHPELLDYLAQRFIDHGWSIKAMHRLIMSSRVYQQSSSAESKAVSSRSIDVENRYLAHYPRRRLDAESIRDSLLSVSGLIDRSMAGVHPFPKPAAWDYTQHKPFKANYDSRHRSVYLMVQRIQRHPFLGLFDGADANAGTAHRTISTTPLQALYLMNDPFLAEATKRLAQRLCSEAESDENRVDHAFKLLYGRPADTEDHATMRSYLTTVRRRLQLMQIPLSSVEPLTWESVCRAMLINNEFMYVE